MNMLSSIKALIPVSEELSEKLTAISNDISIKKGDNIILEGDKYVFDIVSAGSNLCWKLLKKYCLQ